MSEIVEHARSMLAYNQWANERILAAAARLSADDFASLSGKLAHTAETQEFWLANWQGREFDGYSGTYTYDDIVGIIGASDRSLAAYAAGLTDDEWQRSDAWWKRWGYEARAPVGQTLFQVIYHGIQHRAEAAVILTDHGASPGDLDYLQFLQASAGDAEGWPQE